MSSFVTFDYTKKLMREHELRYWTIKDSDGRSILGEQKDSEISIQDSIDQLEDAMGEIQGKYINLSLRSKSRAERGAGGDLKSGIFDLKVQLNQSGGINGVATATDRRLEDLMQTINDLKLQMIEDKHEREKQELKNKIKELEEGNPMLDQVINGLGRLFTNQNQPAPEVQAPVQEKEVPVRKLAGVQPDKNGDGPRIKSALIRLGKIDSNLIDTLESLASFAEKNPDQFLGYIGMLKNM